MAASPSVPPLFLAALAAAAVADVLLPLALVVLARRRLPADLRYAAYGALIFLLFQVFTRVPAVAVLQQALAPRLAASRPLQVAWLAALALSAGLFEEVGRYVGYRWLMRREEKTWEKGVMFGLGHAGIESALLVGGMQLLGLVNLVLLTTSLVPLPLTDAQRQAAAAQIAQVAAQPAWLPLAAVWERCATICVHVGLSVVVLQAFRRGRPLLWVGLAVLAHAIVDFVGPGAPGLLGLSGVPAVLASEAIIALFGLAGLWATWALRGDRGTV